MVRQARTLARAFSFIHHLLLAATISSLLLALHTTSFFALLDTFTYSVLAIGRKPASAPPRWAEDEYPLVVLLAPRLLGGPEGPKLMPTRLLRLIEQQAGEPRPGDRARVLVLVMDLAPFPENVHFEALKREQAGLDEALTALRRKMRVLLLAPIVGDQDEVGRERFRWLVARCREGIDFALPEGRAFGRPIYGYRPQFESLGVLASMRARLQPRDHALGAEAPSRVCEAALRHANDIVGYMKRATEVSTRARDFGERPLNHEYFDFNGNYVPVNAFIPTLWGQAPDVPLAKLAKAQVVFIGEADFQYATTTLGGDPLYTPDVYGAEHFTEMHPVRPLALTRAFLLDVGLGLGLGYVFAFLWDLYTRAAIRFEATPLRPWRRKVLLYLGVRGGLLGFNLAVLVLVIWSIFKLSGFALDRQLWLNPFPIVLGTCIDGLLHSRRRPETDEPHDLTGFLTQHFDVLAQILIIFAALGWVIVYSIRVGH